MKEFYIGFVLFVIITGMLYLFEPDYIKKPSVDHENKIQYDKLILLSMIISIFLTFIIYMMMSCDNKNMKKSAKVVESDTNDTITTTDVPDTTDTSSPEITIKTYNPSGYKMINPNMASIYNT